jgi:hypothetical protein
MRENNIITPDQLELDATIPQCLDNQYVSDTILKNMMDNGLDYSNANIKDMRQNEIYNEFIRSLIYSSQIIINRAFFQNNEFLYSNYLPENKDNFYAFAKLLRSGAIIPYLHLENSLSDELEFDVRKDGERATKELLEQTGYDIPCARLAIDNDENKTKISFLESKFREYFGSLRLKSEDLINAMASELLNRSLDIDEWKCFLDYIDKFSKYAFESGRNMTRNRIYKDWFIKEGADVSRGIFKKPDIDNPFLFELKKIVDLKYNSNIPDMLDRFTFTPVGMPSRVALQDFSESSIPSSQIEDFIDNQLTHIKRIFMANAHKSMNLPLLKDLSIADVVEIREKIDEWKEFKDSQRKILGNPLNVLNNIEDFHNKFDSFQHALSIWYNKKYKQRVTKDRYANFVTVALQIAGQYVLSGLDFSGEQFLKASAHGAVSIIPEKVKGYAVKLLINVIDIGKMKLDQDRSYSLQIMKTNQELIKEDVVQIINDIKRINSDKIEGFNQIADQGKQ